MSDKANATYGPFHEGQDVQIKGNLLHWKIVTIQGQVVVLESGQSGVRRRETLDRIQPWGTGRFRG